MVFSSRDIPVFMLQNTDDQIHPNFISILTFICHFSQLKSAGNFYFLFSYLQVPIPWKQDDDFSQNANTCNRF